MLQRYRDRRDCRRMGPLLQRFADGTLDGAQRARVAQHLAACRRCGLEAATFAQLIARLHRSAEPIDRHVMDRLEAFVADIVVDGVDQAGPLRDN